MKKMCRDLNIMVMFLLVGCAGFDRPHASFLAISHVSLADLVASGWALLDDAAPSTFEIESLRPCSFLKEGESWIDGDEMRKRAVGLKANLSFADGERLLAEQDKIPKELQGFYILLPGTVLRAPDGDLGIPYLVFDGGRWVRRFRWLKSLWYDLTHFACST